MSKADQSGNSDDIIIDLDEPVFTTGVVCRLLDMPVWVLKQLDREAIVSPPRKKEGQARLYSKRELKMVKHCWYYINEYGVKVSGLKVILKIEGGEKL
jgi:DNA-binding transcriptional MerR regulator